MHLLEVRLRLRIRGVRLRYARRRSAATSRHPDTTRVYAAHDVCAQALMQSVGFCCALRGDACDADVVA